MPNKCGDELNFLIPLVDVIMLDLRRAIPETIPEKAKIVNNHKNNMVVPKVRGLQ
jgi:hypothetical protein